MPTTMPDVANHSSATTEGVLEWVGMSHIELPLMFSVAGGGPPPGSAQNEAFF